MAFDKRLRRRQAKPGAVSRVDYPASALRIGASSLAAHCLGHEILVPPEGLEETAHRLGLDATALVLDDSLQQVLARDEQHLDRDRDLARRLVKLLRVHKRVEQGLLVDLPVG